MYYSCSGLILDFDAHVHFLFSAEHNLPGTVYLQLKLIPQVSSQKLLDYHTISAFSNVNANCESSRVINKGRRWSGQQSYATQY